MTGAEPRLRGPSCAAAAIAERRAQSTGEAERGSGAGMRETGREPPRQYQENTAGAGTDGAVSRPQAKSGPAATASLTPTRPLRSAI